MKQINIIIDEIRNITIYENFECGRHKDFIKLPDYLTLDEVIDIAKENKSTIFARSNIRPGKWWIRPNNINKNNLHHDLIKYLTNSEYRNNNYKYFKNMNTYLIN
jgi:hypothetical protein